MQLRAQSWLSLSRTDGVLPPPTSVKKEGHTVALTLLAARPDVYSTYLLLDTMGDPASVKIIRVTMEVRLFSALGRGAHFSWVLTELLW